MDIKQYNFSIDLKKMFQSEIPLSVFKSLPTFDPKKLNGDNKKKHI